MFIPDGVYMGVFIYRVYLLGYSLTEGVFKGDDSRELVGLSRDSLTLVYRLSGYSFTKNKFGGYTEEAVPLGWRVG